MTGNPASSQTMVRGGMVNVAIAYQYEGLEEGKNKNFFFAMQLMIVGGLSIHSLHHDCNILVLESQESCVTEVCHSQGFFSFSCLVNWNVNFVVWNLLTS